MDKFTLFLIPIAIDVTLMDLRLPDMGGSEVIACVRERWSQARIIALTAYSGDFQARSALKAGAVGYLLKSTLRTELIEAIEAVHAGRRRITQEVVKNLAEQNFQLKPVSVLR